MIHVPDVDIRQRHPGYPETYYYVFEHLEEIVNDIAPRHDLSSATCFDLFEGELNAVIGLAKGSDRFVLKIAPFDDLHNEAYFYEELRAQGLPVPELIGSDLSRQLVPYMYLLTRYIKSVPIDELRETDLRQFGFRVGHDLRWLHAVDAEQFGYRLPSGGWSHTDSYGPLRDKFLQSKYMDKRHELFSPAELRRIEALLKPEHLMVARPVMIHGDVRLRNFLYQKSHGLNRELEISAILEPRLIIAGDPMWDLATAMNDDPTFGEGVLAGYTQEHQLAERDYERFHRLRLLAQYWLVCWQFTTQRDYTQALTKCFDLLEELSRL